MTTQHPEALRLAAELDDGYPLTGDAISAAAELRRQHARITELESQLAQRFDAADMTTAAAQGVAYAELPDLSDADGEIWSAILDWGHAKRGADALRKASELERVLVDQLHAFADATHALRASHGQAPAQTDSVLYDPKAVLDVFNGARAGSEKPVGYMRGIRAVIAHWESRPEPHRWMWPAPADSVQEDAARLTSEQEHAIRQGHEIAASDRYFEARPQIDSNDRRNVFQAGFERGWDAARKQGGAT